MRFDDTTEHTYVSINEEYLWKFPSIAITVTDPLKFSESYGNKLYYAVAVVNEDGRITDCVQIMKEAVVSNISSNLAVVKSVGQVLDADENVVIKYTFIQSGEVLTLLVNYESMNEVATMSMGDVFRYAINADGEITETQLIYDVSENSFNDNDYSYSSLSANDMALVYGKITEIQDSKMTVEGADSGIDLTLQLNETEGNTYASVDLRSTANPTNFVSVLSSSLALRATYEGSEYDYCVVALVGESGRFEDCVQIIKETAISNTSTNLAVVNYTGTVSDADDDEVKTYTPLQSGEVSEIVTDNDSTVQISEINMGDIFVIQ